jgi:hypothetical protein
MTHQRVVSLTATNYAAQYAGGAALDDAGPFTEFDPTRLPQIVLGGGGAPSVVYTLYCTSIAGTGAFTQIVTATGAGTYKASLPVQTITRITSDIDPVGTTDLQAGDTWVEPAAREVHVGVAGDIACRLLEDSADAIATAVPIGPFRRRVRIIRITGTAATDLLLGW